MQTTLPGKLKNNNENKLFSWQLVLIPFQEQQNESNKEGDKQLAYSIGVDLRAVLQVWEQNNPLLMSEIVVNFPPGKNIKFLAYTRAQITLRSHFFNGWHLGSSTLQSIVPHTFNNPTQTIKIISKSFRM